MNEQPTKELKYFQRILLLNKYVQYLQRACNHWEWEHEKAQTIIEMKDKEIAALKEDLDHKRVQYTDLNNTFREYVHKFRKERKEEKRAERRLTKQNQQLADAISERDSLQRQLGVCRRLNELLTKQNKL